MGFYSAVLQFTPVGLPDARGRWEIGGALTVVPILPLEDRLVGFGGTKAEDTNRCPVYPRLVAAKDFRAVAFEGGWTPPLAVCGVRANVGALAATVTVVRSTLWAAAVRGSAVFGSIEAAITCSAAATRDAADPTCFGGDPSRDTVSPLGLALDALVTYGGLRRLGVEAYAMLGARRERIHFDVDYVRAPGGPLPALDDHQGLGTTLSRVHGAVGAVVAGPGPVRVGGELYYAPGALLTLRGRATVALGRGR